MKEKPVVPLASGITFLLYEDGLDGIPDRNLANESKSED
jgi:hypothetical protein